MRRWGLTCLLLATPLVFAACASGGASEARETGPVASVVVVNDLRPPAVVTVRVVSSSGARRILGTVPPDATRTFEYDETAFAGQYRLTAERSDGQTVESRTFNLFLAAQVRWSLFNNSLTIGSL